MKKNKKSVSQELSCYIKFLKDTETELKILDTNHRRFLWLLSQTKCSIKKMNGKTQTTYSFSLTLPGMFPGFRTFVDNAIGSKNYD